jgi:hypothetical protein
MGKLKIHAICVALFLVFGHIAMIAGMLDPSILGYKGTNAHQMSSSSDHEYCHPDGHVDMLKQHQKMINGQTPMNNQEHKH